MDGLWAPGRRDDPELDVVGVLVRTLRRTLEDLCREVVAEQEDGWTDSIRVLSGQKVQADAPWSR